MDGNITAIVGIVGTVAAFVLLVIRVLERKGGRKKTVCAEVVNKQIAEGFASRSGIKQYRYYVTFLINGKRRSFSVGEFSYNGYKVGEKGTLTYSGDRLINFQ